MTEQLEAVASTDIYRYAVHTPESWGRAVAKCLSEAAEKIAAEEGTRQVTMQAEIVVTAHQMPQCLQIRIDLGDRTVCHDIVC